jgi:formylglycine-generating enzyme required for sulfatase activity
MGAQADRENAAGFDPEAFPHEQPVHAVRIEAFEIGRYPVTVAEFKAFKDAGGYLDPAYWRAGGFRKTSEPTQWQRQLESRNRPVVGVSWFEAMAYAAWAEWRLPTEAEWEYAARGREGRRYPWGGAAPDESRANHRELLQSPSPVGLFPAGATPEGICDLAGNVWEWVATPYERYGPDKSPQDSRKRVLRGGSWQSEAKFLRGSERITAEPVARFSAWGPIGFRCARSL